VKSNEITAISRMVPDNDILYVITNNMGFRIFINDFEIKTVCFYMPPQQQKGFVVVVV